MDEEHKKGGQRDWRQVGGGKEAHGAIARPAAQQHACRTLLLPLQLLLLV